MKFYFSKSFDVYINAVLTIFITRIWLWFTQISSPYSFGIKLHHYMYGLCIVVFIFLIKLIFKKFYHVYNKYFNIGLGIGIGLFIDELPLIIKYGNGFLGWEQYFAFENIWGVFLILIIYYIVILLWNKTGINNKN